MDLLNLIRKTPPTPAPDPDPVAATAPEEPEPATRNPKFRRKFPPLRLRQALSLGGLSVRELLRRTWCRLNENEVMTRAAAVSYYAMAAMVPFLGVILLVTVQLLPDVTGGSGGRGVGNMTVEELRAALKAFFPREAYGVVEEQIGRLQKQTPVGFLSLSVVITLWLASSLFVAVIDALNRIYGVTETRPFWRLRLVAIGMTVLQSMILVGSLLAIVVWPQVLDWLGMSRFAQLVATTMQWTLVVIVVLLSFALTFYIGPDADQHWEWVTPGSLAGTVMFLLVTFIFRIYVQNFTNYDRTYGSLGGVMVLLLWFWISSVVLLAAAQMNKIIEDASPLGKRYGQKIEPTLAPNFAEMPPEPARTDASPQTSI